MKRDPGRLVERELDCLIIGGGVYGAAIARDAALRGLHVALVEREDFGHATSARSQKILHGGLRALQSANLAACARGLREQRIFMEIAPHLVSRRPFLVPLRAHAERVLAAVAAAAYGALGRGIAPDHHPAARVVSADDCRRLAPGISEERCSGGLLWEEAQMYDSERLTLELIRAAADDGAVVVNHARAELLSAGSSTPRVRVHDEASDTHADVAARFVVDATGPWSISRPPANPPSLVRAVALVTRPLPLHVALGLSPNRGAHTTGRLFLTPWRDVCLLGTTYHACTRSTPYDRVDESEVDHLLELANRAYPAAALERADVRRVHVGLLSVGHAAGQPAAHGRIETVRRNVLRVCGNKYTEARHLGEQVVDRIEQTLRGRADGRASRTTALPGALCELDRHADELARAEAGLSTGNARHLARLYGSHARKVLRLARREPALGELLPGSPSVPRAAVAHAIREEMAVTLSDVVLRRIGVAATGHPGRPCLVQCASVMRHELGWTKERCEQEIATTNRELDALLPGADPTGTSEAPSPPTHNPPSHTAAL